MDIGLDQSEYHRTHDLLTGNARSSHHTAQTTLPSLFAYSNIRFEVIARDVMAFLQFERWNSSNSWLECDAFMQCCDAIIVSIKTYRQK